MIALSQAVSVHGQGWCDWRRGSEKEEKEGEKIERERERGNVFKK